MYHITTDNTKLRNLILENPTLPLVVFATEDANSGEYSSELASCNCYIGMVLDLMDSDLLPNDEKVYTDEDDLDEDFRNKLADNEEYISLSDDEFDKVIIEKMNALKPYWKKCIIVKVDSF